MSIEISFGGTCRDISKLPQDENELRTFFMDKLVPAMWDDFHRNVVQQTQDRGAEFGGLGERGCEVGGTITIRI